MLAMDEQFARDLERLMKKIKGIKAKFDQRLEKAHRWGGKQVEAAAVKRAPVDTSNMKESIFSNTYAVKNGFITETGTNIQEYPIFVEFGTEYIAHGKVLALGTDWHITDADAIHDWAAKRKDGGSPEESMPWLRPAWMSCRESVIARLRSVVEDIGGKGKVA